MNLRKMKKKFLYFRQVYTHRDALKFAYLAGFNFHYNLGDEAIYEAIQNMLAPFLMIDLPKDFSDKIYQKVLPHVAFSILSGGTRIGGKLSMITKIRLASRISRYNFVLGTGVEDEDFWRQRYGNNCRSELMI